MPKELVISAAPHETRVAILEDGQLCEIYIEREKEFALVGSIYKGRVTRVLPGMQSAFVDIGLDSDAFLYVGDFLENLEDYDHVVAPVEGKVEKMEQQGGEVFASPAGGEASGHESLRAESPAPDSAGQESFSAAATGQGESSVSESPEDAQPPMRETPRPPAPFGRHENRPGGFGHNRHDQGRRRGGRWRQGRGGGGGHRYQGRDLPPSKYASPRPYSPPGGQPSEEPPSDYEPVILPGESLAKYKDRVPHPAGQSSPAASVSPMSPVEVPLSPAPGYSRAAEEHEDELTASSEKHESEEAPREETSGASNEAPGASTAQDSRTFSEYQALPEEPPRAIYEAPEAASPAASAAPHELSDEEVSSLAEQLAEARHEEVSAKAEADAELGMLEEELPHGPEGAAETDEFIAEAESEEHEEQVEHDEHQEHEEAADIAAESASGLGAAAMPEPA